MGWREVIGKGKKKVKKGWEKNKKKVDEERDRENK